jgi:type II restriction/modification system DNA methylase subunit YeeA
VRLLQEIDWCAFQVSKKIGPFEIPGELSRSWIAEPRNPNNRPNADVIRPSWIAIDVVRSPRDVWIVDFGLEMSEDDAALYEAPFKYIRENVWPIRKTNNRAARKRYWWRHGDGQPAMRAAIKGASRFIVTPEVSKHRIFRWAPSAVLPDCKLMVIARDDDTTFGILESRHHVAWSLRVGSWHGVGNDPRYTPTTCFQTFPFPEGLTPNIPAAQYANDPRAKAIAKAAVRLNELREAWLNPPDLTERVREVAPGYPDRILPIDDDAAAILKKRTLTNLYNERPTWLGNAHRDLDATVAAAYGWPANLLDEQILERLFALNQNRAPG